MFQLKNIYQDGFNFPSSREEGRDSVLRAILLFVSLQVIELNVDSLIASFQQCEIGKRITKFFILSISFKWREDVIEIELPNIVYSVFSVTEINKIRNCLKSVIGQKVHFFFDTSFIYYLILTRQPGIVPHLCVESHYFQFSTIYRIEFYQTLLFVPAGIFFNDGMKTNIYGIYRPFFFVL